MNMNSDTMFEPEIIKIIKIWQTSKNTDINLRQKGKIKFSLNLNFRFHSNTFLVLKNWKHSLLIWLIVTGPNQKLTNSQLGSWGIALGVYMKCPPEQSQRDWSQANYEQNTSPRTPRDAEVLNQYLLQCPDPLAELFCLVPETSLFVGDTRLWNKWRWHCSTITRNVSLSVSRLENHNFSSKFLQK